MRQSAPVQILSDLFIFDFDGVIDNRVGTTVGLIVVIIDSIDAVKVTDGIFEFIVDIVGVITDIVAVIIIFIFILLLYYYHFHYYFITIIISRVWIQRRGFNQRYRHNRHH